MALLECPDCKGEISDQASACPKCGRPRESKDALGSWTGAWQAVGKTKTPINVFALAMMACAAVFGFSATQLGENALAAFTYALHTFLAIAGMFFVILLFCRRAIYHPDDLAKAKEHGVDFGEDKPLLAAVLIGAMMIAYGGYQGLVARKQIENTQHPSGATEANQSPPGDNQG